MRRRPTTVLVATLAATVTATALTACTPRDDSWTDDLDTTCRNGDRIYAIVTDEVDGLAVVDDDPTCRAGNR